MLQPRPAPTKPTPATSSATRSSTSEGAARCFRSTRAASSTCSSPPISARRSVADRGDHDHGAPHPHRQRRDEPSEENRLELLTSEEVCAALRCKRTKVFEYLAAGQ